MMRMMLYEAAQPASSRARRTGAPLGFIVPSQPVRQAKAPSGRGWVHEVKHDGYRLQVHVGNPEVDIKNWSNCDQLNGVN
jgi:bifunctional non-homologous end joining protein LigD